MRATDRSPRERFVEAMRDAIPDDHADCDHDSGCYKREYIVAPYRALALAFADESHDYNCAFGRKCRLSTCRTEYRATLLRECGLEVGDDH